MTLTLRPGVRVAVGVTVACCAWLDARAAAPPAREEIRQHYAAVLKARDALVKQLTDRQAADAKAEPARDLALTLTGAIVRRSEKQGIVNVATSDVECGFSRRGGKWFAGTGRARTFNLARHDVDPAALTVASGRLAGKLAITLNPDPWVPPDHKPKHIRCEIDATVADGNIAGTFRVEGDYAPGEGRVTGQVVGVAEQVQVPTLAEEAKLPADPAAACLQMAMLASRAYQQARAAAMALRHYPLSFTEALACTSLAVPQWPAGEKSLAHVRDYLAELRRLLERQLAAKGDGQFVVETLEVADPFFGPYFDDEPLALNADGVPVLPEGVGTGDSQRWQMIPRWKTIAAFASDERRDLDTPLLPEIVPAAGGRYTPNAAALGNLYDKPAGGTFGWTDDSPPFRFVSPPGQTFNPLPGKRGRGADSDGVHGAEKARWYGFADVVSPRDVELYASAFGKDYGKLWVNDELVWVSRMIAGNGSIDPPLLKVRLRKGRNTLLLACQAQRGPSFFWVMLSTGAGPLPAERRAERREAQRKATVSLPPSGLRGRRGDWTGRFPEADPPLGWNIDKGINLIWRVPMPDYSAGHPLLVGDRLLVNCEPHTLYCLDKDTGEVLWKRDAHVFEFVPEDQRAAAMKSWLDAKANEKSPERRALEQELAGFADSRRKLEEAGTLTPAAEKEFDARMAPVQAKLAEFGSKARLYSQWCGKLGVRGHGWSNNYGSTFPAPCSDGKCVWVKYNTGVLACFDLNGKREWIVPTHMSGGVEQLASPALADGKVIIQGRLSDRQAAQRLVGTKGSPAYWVHRLAAYDQRTGQLVWERPTLATGGYGGPGGFVPMRVSDGKRTRELLVTHSGLLFDPRDGRLLNNAIGAGWAGWYGDPFVAENRAYLYRSGPVKAVEVWLEPDGRVGSKLVVEALRGGGNAGAVWWNGHVFGSSNAGGGPTSLHDVHVADMRTGEVVGSITPALRSGGLAYTCSASARKYGVVVGTGSGTNASWSIGGSPAEVGFLVPGPNPYMVGGGLLDAPMVAQPIFEGQRMYARTYESVLCIGCAKPEGRQYALRHKAETILAGLPPRPAVAGVLSLAPPKDYLPPEGVPVEPCDVETAPGKWLIVGPFPLKAGSDPLDAMGGPARALLAPGMKLTQGEATCEVAALDAKFVRAAKGWQEEGRRPPKRVYRASCAIDVVNPIGRKMPTVSYYYAVLRTERQRVVTVEMGEQSPARAWIGGRPVVSGGRARLEPGCHPVLLRVELTEIPPFIDRLVAVFCLREIEDPEKGYTEWLAAVREARPRLEEVIADLPGSDEADRAKRILQALAPADAPATAPGAAPAGK